MYKNNWEDQHHSNPVASQQSRVCIPFNTIRNHLATRGGDFTQ